MEEKMEQKPNGINDSSTR
ncbi:unnamed protein product, partial [Rotaria sp. Silwood1]